MPLWNADVRVHQRWDTDDIEVGIFCRHDNGQVERVKWDGERWEISIVEAASSWDDWPSLKFPRPLARKLYEALDKHYRFEGQPPEADAKREGRLEAMSDHLRDMRELVFKRRDP